MQRQYAAIEILKALSRGGPIDVIESFIGDRRIFDLCGLLDSRFFIEGSRTHFGALASKYMPFALTSPHMVKALDWQMQALPQVVESLLSQLRPADDLIVSDLGAGAGAISTWPLAFGLAEQRQLQRLSLICYDVATEMKQATFTTSAQSGVPQDVLARFEPHLEDIVREVRRCKYRVQDFTSPEFSVEREFSTHVVISSFVFHHLSLQGKFEAANCMWRLLKDRGLAVFVDEFRTFEQNMEEVDRARETGIPFALECFVDDKWYADVFGGVGFRIVHHYLSPDGRVICLLLRKP